MVAPFTPFGTNAASPLHVIVSSLLAAMPDVVVNVICLPLGLTLTVIVGAVPLPPSSTQTQVTTAPAVVAAKRKAPSLSVIVILSFFLSAVASVCLKSTLVGVSPDTRVFGSIDVAIIGTVTQLYLRTSRAVPYGYQHNSFAGRYYFNFILIFKFFGVAK